VLHLNPDQIETHVGHLGGDIDAGRSDSACNDRLALFEQFSDGILSGVLAQSEEWKK